MARRRGPRRSLAVSHRSLVRLRPKATPNLDPGHRAARAAEAFEQQALLIAPNALLIGRSHPLIRKNGGLIGKTPPLIGRNGALI